MPDEDDYDLKPAAGPSPTPAPKPAARPAPKPAAPAAREVRSTEAPEAPESPDRPAGMSGMSAVERARLVELVRKGDPVARGRLAFTALAGAGVLLATCAVLAIVLHTLIGGGLVALFVLLCLTVVPLLFWAERRLGGPYLTSAERGIGGEGGEEELDAVEPHALGAPWDAAAGLLMTGPRWVLAGAGLRGKRRDVDAAVIRRAAGVVADLLPAANGLPLAALFHDGDDAARLSRAVEHLSDHDWIGHAADGGRLFLSTTGKTFLRANGFRAG